MARRWVRVFFASVIAAAAVAGVTAVIPTTASATHTLQPPRPCPHRSTDDITDKEIADGKAPAVIKSEAWAGVTIRCVHVGGGDVYPRGRGPIALTRFYPDTLQVHRGDIVEFRPAPAWAGTTHAPGFFPEDADVRAVRTPLAKAVPELVRADEVPRAVTFHHDIATGSAATAGCGLKSGGLSNGFPPQLPCTIGPDSVRDKVIYDLNEMFLNTGRPAPFWVRIDLEPGLYRYHCTYHPWMVGQIEVVGAKKTVPTHTAVADQARRDAEVDIAEGEVLHAKLSKPTWRQVEDRRVWRVTAGATTDSGRATLVAYMPAGLRVREGDGVEFVNGRPDAPTAAGRTGEAQTVTFPGSLLGGFFFGGCTFDHCVGTPWFDPPEPIPDQGPPAPYAERTHTQAVPHGMTLFAFPWGCEYDGWDTGNPAPPTWVPRVGCPPLAGTRGYLELAFGENTVDSQRAPDDAVSTTTTMHNSGWMVPATYAWPNRPANDAVWKGEPWPTTFPANFPREGSFTYGCLLHPDVMTGTISVDAR